MRKLFSPVLMILAIALILPSCVSKKKFTELMSQKDSAQSMLAQTQQKVQNLEENVGTLETKVNDLTDQKNNLESRASQLDRELAGVKTDLMQTKSAADKSKQDAEKSMAANTRFKSGIGAIFSPFEKNGLDLMVRNDLVVLALSDSLLFRSGSARLSSAQKESLQTVANTLKANPELMITVQGHTDYVPLKEGAPWENNYQLGMARARAVRNALVNMGADAKQLTTAAHANKRPESSENMSMSDVMAKNRRTDLVIVATNTDELFELHKSL